MQVTVLCTYVMCNKTSLVLLSVMMYLLANEMVRRETIVEPREVSRDALLVVHSRRYLNSLNVSSVVLHCHQQ